MSGRHADLLTTIYRCPCVQVATEIDAFHDDHPEFAFATENDTGRRRSGIHPHSGMSIWCSTTATVRTWKWRALPAMNRQRTLEVVSADPLRRGLWRLPPRRPETSRPSSRCNPAARPLVRVTDGDGVALTLGVETIETVRARMGPGEQWAARMSAAHFDVDDDIVVKTGIVACGSRGCFITCAACEGSSIHREGSPTCSSPRPMFPHRMNGSCTTRRWLDAARSTRMGCAGETKTGCRSALFEFDQLTRRRSKGVSPIPNTTLKDTRFRTERQGSAVDGCATAADRAISRRRLHSRARMCHARLSGPRSGECDRSSRCCVWRGSTTVLT